MSASPRSTVIFDLGGVLIDWNPRHLYRKLFPGDEAAMEHFLAHVCNDAWNVQQDAGRGFAEAVALLKKEHPAKTGLIDAYWERWVEMLAGPINDTVDILALLRERRVPLYALTNWSAETWPVARPLFPFLDWFDGIVVSGQERMAKPDPRIFRLLLERFAVAPEIGDLHRRFAPQRGSRRRPGPARHPFHWRQASGRGACHPVAPAARGRSPKIKELTANIR